MQMPFLEKAIRNEKIQNLKNRLRIWMNSCLADPHRWMELASIAKIWTAQNNCRKLTVHILFIK